MAYIHDIQTVKGMGGDLGGTGAGHILSRSYCTKHGNRTIDNAATAHFTLHISILQLHNCTLKYALDWETVPQNLRKGLPMHPSLPNI